MNKKSQTWLELASNDLEFAKQIIANKQRSYFACHYCHQAMEKLLKAVVQEESGSIPPRTHNLMTLARLSKLAFSEEQSRFLLRINPHYMATRYPDDLVRFYKQYTEEYAAKLLQETKEIFVWVKNSLIQKV